MGNEEGEEEWQHDAAPWPITNFHTGNLSDIEKIVKSITNRIQWLIIWGLFKPQNKQVQASIADSNVQYNSH